VLAGALGKGRRHGHRLRTIQADWRWLHRDVHASCGAGQEVLDPGAGYAGSMRYLAQRYGCHGVGVS
jgi:cyclopropane fatty-acyl-phospholipid synthase-like methyltransferase